MKALLSIKPKYIEEINNGSKLYEFRKSIFKNDVDVIIVYASSPTKKIVGQIIVDKIIVDTPQNLWSKYQKHSGIIKEEFFEYFKNKEKGYAIKIKKYINYNEPIDPYEHNADFTPPQSYAYIDNVCPFMI